MKGAYLKLKNSNAVIALVCVIREIPNDIRLCLNYLRRNKEVQGYLNSHESRKLHIGCGGNYLSGWLNTDAFPKNSKITYLNVTKSFPFPDQSFDFIFSEHMVEHIRYEEGQQMLSECLRVLKSGGKVRISTPNLAKMATLLVSPFDTEKTGYVQAATKKYIPQNTKYLPGFVLNNFYWDFAHHFIYDPETIVFALESAGFEEVKRVKSGESESPDLCDLEHHAAAVGAELDSFETMIFEAQRP